MLRVTHTSVTRNRRVTKNSMLTELVTVLRIKAIKWREKMSVRNHLHRRWHYSSVYSPTIACRKIISSYFQFVKHVCHAPAVPDQPIKASMTYWLVSNNLRSFRFIHIYILKG